MTKGKVVILGGNARSGKTTLAFQLSENGFNRISFDTLTDAVEDGLGIDLSENPDQTLYPFFEKIVEKSLEEAKECGVNTVIDMYDFTPKTVSQLPTVEECLIYFLAYPGLTVDEIKYNVTHFAKPTDWIAQVNEQYLSECAQRFYERNQLLQEECETYHMELVDTTCGSERGKVLQKLFQRITG